MSDDFRHEIHISALRWTNEIKRSSQLKTLLNYWLEIGAEKKKKIQAHTWIEWPVFITIYLICYAFKFPLGHRR